MNKKILLFSCLLTIMNCIQGSQNEVDILKQENIQLSKQVEELKLKFSVNFQDYNNLIKESNELYKNILKSTPYYYPTCLAFYSLGIVSMLCVQLYAGYLMSLSKKNYYKDCNQTSETKDSDQTDTSNDQTPPIED